jgi:hypothetical protein
MRERGIRLVTDLAVLTVSSCSLDCWSPSGPDPDPNFGPALPEKRSGLLVWAASGCLALSCFIVFFNP